MRNIGLAFYISTYTVRLGSIHEAWYTAQLHITEADTGF